VAASLLATTLAGDNDNNAALLGLDPNLAAANSDIQLGQAMQQAGLSTAPASPAQAAGRLAQVLAGTYLHSSALNDLGKAYADVPEKMAQVLEKSDPKNALIKALRSDSLPVRMAAMQVFPKTMTLLTEPGDVARGAQRMTGVGPNTNPLSTEGDLAADQAHSTGRPISPLAAAYGKAEAEARAKAPYEAGGEGVVSTPNGPKEIPISAATRAAMQPNVRPPGLSVGPSGSAAFPPPETEPQSTAAPNNGAQQGVTPKDQSRVAAQSAVPGLSGKPLPNAAIEPAVKADTEEVAKDREAALKGQSDMATIRSIQDFAPKVKTGWSADTKLEGARILKGMGVTDDKINEFLKTDVAAGQILQKKFVELSAAAARTMGAREPGSVIQMFAKAYPNLGTDPAAIQLQTNALYMDRLRSQHIAEQKTNYLNDSINGVQSTGQYRGLKGFNEAFNKSNPVESYLHAAEAMSGAPEPWKRIKDANQQQKIIDFIPPGSTFMAPDGKKRVKPGAGVQQ
jgi:hypothetical protein